MEIFKKDARKSFIYGIVWILLMALMITCVIIDINADNWGIAVFAMFACSCDGFSAFISFRDWWQFRQMYKMFKEDQKRSDTE